MTEAGSNKRTPQESYRKLTFLLCGLLLIAVLTWAGAQLAAPSSSHERAGDKRAAGYADFTLPRLLAEVADSSAEDRLSAVMETLDNPQGVGVRVSSGHSWIRGDTTGQRIPIVVFYYWEDASIIGLGGDYYGRACRIYTVTDRDISGRPIECPSGTPETPAPGVSLDTSEWFDAE